MSRPATAAAGFTLILIATSGCSMLGGSAAAPHPPASATASPVSATVSIPSGFPTDVPVYPGGHLTSGAAFNSSGQTAWGVTWQTADTAVKVQAFFATKLKQGDWTISSSGSANGSYSAVFARKSDPKVNGVITVTSSSGVTTIAMSLVDTTG